MDGKNNNLLKKNNICYIKFMNVRFFNKNDYLSKLNISC